MIKLYKLLRDEQIAPYKYTGVISKNAQHTKSLFPVHGKYFRGLLFC